MRRLPLYVLLVLTVILASCRQGPRKIPARTMVQIYADMLMADQWILENTSERRTADTSLFYEPIFNKYGYSTEDYQYSLHQYLKKPDKFDKLVTKVNDNLEERKKCLENQLSSDQSGPED